ncbi:MAG: hypothetical protein R2690_16380 [Acidimicrobiales bacterium]
MHLEADRLPAALATVISWTPSSRRTANVGSSSSTSQRYSNTSRGT